MTVKSNAAVTVEFTTSHPYTMVATNADSLPTGVLFVNGVTNAATVTISAITAGVYSAAVTLPTLAAGDVVGLRILATVAGVAGQGIVWQDDADTARVSEIPGLVSSFATYGLAALNALLTSTGIKVATNADKTGYTASTVSDKTGYALASTVMTCADATEALTRLPDATAGATGGLSLVGSKMDLVDDPNSNAIDAFMADFDQTPADVASATRTELTAELADITDLHDTDVPAIASVAASIQNLFEADVEVDGAAKTITYKDKDTHGVLLVKEYDDVGTIQGVS
jgi:hypothetical protein